MKNAYDHSLMVSSFANVSLRLFMKRLTGLIDEAKELFIQDDHLISSLLAISDSIMRSEPLKKRFDLEVAVAEEERFSVERAKYESPQSLVDRRYELLDSIVTRVSAKGTATADVDFRADDTETLFPGEASARDKSRLFLQKVLMAGMKTFGMDHNSTSEVHDFCAMLASDLEQGELSRCISCPILFINISRIKPRFSHRQRYSTSSGVLMIPYPMNTEIKFVLCDSIYKIQRIQCSVHVFCPANCRSLNSS
jgi:hypothetical protein